jgi:hypothetical protein
VRTSPKDSTFIIWITTFVNEDTGYATGLSQRRNGVSSEVARDVNQ